MILSPTVGGSQENIQDDTKPKGTSGSEPACWPEFAQILSDLRVDRDTGERGWALRLGCLVGPPWASQQKDDQRGRVALYHLLLHSLWPTSCSQEQGRAERFWGSVSSRLLEDAEQEGGQACHQIRSRGAGGGGFHSSVWSQVKVVAGSGNRESAAVAGSGSPLSVPLPPPLSCGEELLASPASFLVYFLTLGWNIFSSFLTKHGS